MLVLLVELLLDLGPLNILRLLFLLILRSNLLFHQAFQVNGSLAVAYVPGFDGRVLPGQKDGVRVFVRLSGRWVVEWSGRVFGPFGLA